MKVRIVIETNYDASLGGPVSTGLTPILDSQLRTLRAAMFNTGYNDTSITVTTQVPVQTIEEKVHVV